MNKASLGRLAIIVVAQLLGVSLWFSANAAFDDLARAWSLTASDVGTLTVAVQAGFIAGTLLFAISGFADRHAASRIFAACALAGALANAAFAFLAHGLVDAAVYRFATGFALAGVYPLGMKLIVSWEPERASEALAWLVGMFTFGTALPYLVRAAGASWPWQWVASASSVLAVGAARSRSSRWATARTCRRAAPDCAGARCWASSAIPSRRIAPRRSRTSGTCGSSMRCGPLRLSCWRWWYATSGPRPRPASSRWHPSR